MFLKVRPRQQNQHNVFVLVRLRQKNQQHNVFLSVRLKQQNQHNVFLQVRLRQQNQHNVYLLVSLGQQITVYFFGSDSGNRTNKLGRVNVLVSLGQAQATEPVLSVFWVRSGNRRNEFSGSGSGNQTNLFSSSDSDNKRKTVFLWAITPIVES